MSAQLEVRGLGVAVDGAVRVEALDFDLRPGEVLALIGRSGSGKTLTARALLGLAPAGAVVSGAVRLDGRDLLGLPERAWQEVRGRRIGLVLQEPATALNPVAPIGRQVAEGLQSHRLARSGQEARDMAAAALAAIGLDSASAPPSRRPHQLSGGQRQRAALAAALTLRPDILIADEPTAALDPLTADAVLRRLVEPVRRRERGGALLLIGHDLARLAGVADRLLVLEQGRVVASGPVTEVLAGRAPAVEALRRAAATPSRPPAPPVSTAPVLEVRGVSRTYPSGGGRGGGVRDVSLKLRPGERMAVVGETGAGKSTLLRLVLGLERPDRGEVAVLGHRFNPAPGARRRALRRHLQPVFQDPAGSFDPLWTAGRIVAEPLGLLGFGRTEAERRVAAALEAVGLVAADAGRPARTFSGGQRQRLALARALAVGPDLLVLDEATSALDVVTRSQVLDLLDRLGRERGTALLMVTHDLAVARRLADRVMVLQAGAVAEEGSVAQVLDAPAQPYTRALVDACPELETVLRARGA